MEALTGPQVDVFEVGLGTAGGKTHLARQEVDRLVFPLVVLQRKSLTRFDVKEFAYVLVRVRPDEFVAPRFFDTPRSVLQSSDSGWLRSRRLLNEYSGPRVSPEVPEK